MLQVFRITLFIGILGISAWGYAIPDRDDMSDLIDCISQDNDTREKVECYILLSQYYRQINKDTSLMFSDLAYILSKKIGYTEGEIDAIYKKSLTLESMGDNIGAYHYAKECLAIADSIHDSVRMAKACYQMAGLEIDFSNNKSAIQYLHKARQIFSQLGDTSAMCAIFNEFGNFYEDRIIYDSSAYYYHKAIDHCELIGRTDPLGRIIGNLGRVYSKLGDYNNAKKYLLISLNYNIENNDIEDIPSIYSRLGVLASDMDDYETALEYYLLADSAFNLIGDSLGIMEVYVNRAQMYRNQGNYDAAMELLEEALIFYRKQKHSDGMIAIWTNMAWVYAQKHMTDKAFIYYDSCIYLADKSRDVYRKQQVFGDMYLLHQQLGNHKDALTAYIQYQQFEDSIINLEKTAIINDLLLKYEKEKDQLQILNLENENLRRIKQRNLLFFIALAVVALAFFLAFFLTYKNRKNRIISNQKIKQLEEEKKHMAARFLVEGQEKERKRVALELHDNLGVLLSATKMQFSEIRDKSPDNKALINKASKFLEQASNDIRKISHNLMPGLLTKLGLYEALEDLIETLDEAKSMDARIEIVGPQDRLPENKEIMIYRMMQEIMNNTIKHAEADKIDLNIIVQPDEMNISYFDNGKGFDVKEVLSRKTMGLKSIRSRVKFMDGNISIDSSAGKGTFYRICIPLAPIHNS